MHRLFKLISVGDQFECNGNLYQKKSSKTATMLASRYGMNWHFDHAGKWFHFGQNESINGDAVFWVGFYPDCTIEI